MERHLFKLSGSGVDSPAPRYEIFDSYHAVAIIAIGALVAMAATIMVMRAMYPYDLYIWADTAHT